MCFYYRACSCLSEHTSHHSTAHHVSGNQVLGFIRIRRSDAALGQSNYSFQRAALGSRARELYNNSVLYCTVLYPYLLVSSCLVLSCPVSSCFLSPSPTLFFVLSCHHTTFTSRLITIMSYHCCHLYIQYVAMWSRGRHVMSCHVISVEHQATHRSSSSSAFVEVFENETSPIWPIGGVYGCSGIGIRDSGFRRCGPPVYCKTIVRSGTRCVAFQLSSATATVTAKR